MSANFHEPVLLNQAMEMLALSSGATVVDGTLGDAGHAQEILKLTAPGGTLVALDWDKSAILVGQERLDPFKHRVIIANRSYSDLKTTLEENRINHVDAIFLDLGVSSRQLDSSTRGFRFKDSRTSLANLDMRMDDAALYKASDLLATSSEETLASWFADYGELRGSFRLAKTIVSSREKEPIQTASDLIKVINKAGIGRGRRHNPATLVFQALRIAVNEELTHLKKLLFDAPKFLKPGGRLVIISYHSLEDRLVKHAFRDGERGCVCPPKIPLCICGKKPVWRRINKRPLVADERELSNNSRSRSAKLRGAVHIIEETRKQDVS